MSNLLKQIDGLISEVKDGWPVISRERIDLSIPGMDDLSSKIPYFGEVWKEVRDVNGVPTDYYVIVRQFGWAVCFGITTENKVVMNIQWKPGLNQASLELAPGGIGRVDEEIGLPEVLALTKEQYRKETGYGAGTWKYLGRMMVESGKYRGAAMDSHGLYANLWMATGLERVSETEHASNELIRLIEVPVEEFPSVLRSGYMVEESAKQAATLALLELGIDPTAVPAIDDELQDLLDRVS